MTTSKTIEEWAKIFEGRKYREEVTQEEKAQLKSDGIVLLVGASDDMIISYGAIEDEFSNEVFYDEKSKELNSGNGDSYCSEECKYYRSAKKTWKEIERIWSDTKEKWIFTCEIKTHIKGNIVVEYGEYGEFLLFKI